MNKPYTYLIGWTQHKKYYYGVRYAKKCDPSDLWNTYFTSSASVLEFRELYGEPDIIEIRKTFQSSMAARAWEERVLKKMKVVLREDFLNKHDAHAPPIRYGKRPKSIGRKISNKMKGKRKTPEHNKKVSDGVKAYYKTHSGPMTGKKHSVETREKIKKKRAKQIITEETKQKMCDNHNGGMKGKEHKASSKKRIAKANIGLKMFNNGKVNKKFFPGKEPEGFVLGSMRRNKDE